MKITVETSEQVVSVEHKGNPKTIEDFYDICEQLAMAAGFRPETVREWFRGEEEM